ncbi:MAG TPA: CDP-archaeol synthase, partial [Candidatus Thermoplasmatota archaeon]|nr:CDP-archaeol synthase [Candidatus Thermoplasmatota archaeon]
MAWISILHALWLFLPAYVANMSPVFSAKLLPRWNAPMDGGRTSKDGKRVLGPGKTWRGLVGGIVAGAATAVAMA